MKKLPLILTGFVLLVFLLGCSDENGWSANGPIDKGEEVILTLNLRVPGISNPATYALTEQDENELKTIDILVFKEDGANETFLYQTHATDINNSNKNFRVQLQKSTGSDKHRIVLVANARDAVDAVKADFSVGMNKDEVLEKIIFKTDKVWNTTSPTDFTSLPMWGETSVAQAITASTSSLGTISLMRAVARIDVELDMNSSDLPLGFGTRFKMEDVKVYNANNISAIAPLKTNLKADIVYLPTLVSDCQLVTPAIAYSHHPTDFGFVREIYLGEADNTSQTDDNKRVCILVGGYYTKDGDAVNETQKTWYRLDFYKRNTNPQEYLDILRNHRYRVNITSVDGPGYKTEEEAFSSRPINIKSEITVWNETPISNVVFNGQYVLGVSQSQFSFTKSAYTKSSEDNFVSIATDYKSNNDTIQGWKVSSIVDGSGNPITDWLKTSESSGNAGVTTNMQLLLTENNTRQERKGYIHISAGRLSYVIEVNQSLEQPLALTIKDSTGDEIVELEFVSQEAGVVPAAQQFTVSWLPTDKACTLNNLAIDGKYFSFNTSYDVIQTGESSISAGGTGKQVFTIAPTALNQSEIDKGPFVKASKIDFMVSNGIKIKSKSLYIRQVHYGMKAEIDPIYLLNGKEQSFLIKSNSKWKLDGIVDPAELVSSYDANQSGGYNMSTGDKFYFTLKTVEKAADLEKSVTFRFSDPTGKFPEVVEVTVSPTACGIGGKASKLKIGQREYLTHQYGTKCWMVENSKEGNTDVYYYGGSIGASITWDAPPYKTYYQYYYAGYTYSACPDGWHVPTLEDAQELTPIINAAINLNDKTKGAQYWAGTNDNGYGTSNSDAALTGCADYRGAWYWRYWATEGYWWLSNGEYLRGVSTGIHKANTYNRTTAFYSIRCVQD